MHKLAHFFATAAATFALLFATSLQAAGLEKSLQAELYFGLSKGAEPISEADFDAFVTAEITPRFAAGFTIFAARGLWQGGEESSRVLMVLSAPAEQAALERKLDEIAQKYIEKFEQESVLKIIREANAEFIAPATTAAAASAPAASTATAAAASTAASAPAAQSAPLALPPQSKSSAPAAAAASK